MMRVLLFFVVVLLSLSAIVDAQSLTCPDGSSFVNCLVAPCSTASCKKGNDFCVNDYCGGCHAKCQCAADSDCHTGESCKAGFCALNSVPTTEPSTTAAPSCPSSVPTAECICQHKNQYWAIGGFFDGCNSCTCQEDGRVFCTKKACPIIPTDAPTTFPTATPVNTCVITNNDYSSCENGLTPCALTLCLAGSTCIAHRCGTENNQCAATCACGDDSHCQGGSVCAANEFGIKVCKKSTNSITTAAPVDTCVINNEDFSSCANGITPCSTVRCASGACVPHRCGTENNQCAAACSCSDDSQCGGGEICAANEFGIKVCTEDPNRECADGQPGVRCFARPCSVSGSKCKKGSDFCVDDYCGGCNAKCQCDANTDCNAGESCQADWKGRKFCAPIPTCDYNGKVYKAGQRFPSEDGCNSCFCSESGVVGCTKKACICDKATGFASCKRAPCSTKACKTGVCVNDYCGGCNAKCQCNKNSDCATTEICQQDERSEWSYCVRRPRPTTRPTTTTTKRPSRTTTTTTTTTPCQGKVCPAILCANRPTPCKYQCGINYCSCTDFCKCLNDNHCDATERCEGAAFGREGKCVKRRGLLSQLDRF